MKRNWVLLAVLVSGCATSPAPNFQDGNYYMAGDENCKWSQTVIGQPRILCYNSKDQATGYRDAMTPEQMVMYQQTRSQQSHVKAPGPMPIVQYPTMATPQVTPIVPPGGNQVRCIGVGIYTNCRAY